MQEKNPVKKDLTSRTLKGFKWAFFNTFIKFILQLLIISILAHILTPSDFGLLSITLIFINFTQLFSQLGIGPALIQRQNLSEKHIRAGFTLVMILSFVFLIITFFSAPYISIFFKNTKINIILKWISVTFVLRGLGVVSFSLLQKKLLFKRIMIIQSISYSLSYGIVGIILALMGKGVWALVFAEMSNSFLRGILSYYFSPHSIKPLVVKKEIKELFNFGGGFTIAKIFNYVALNGDNFTIGKLMGVEKLGLYSRAYSLMTLPATYFASILDKILFPAMSEIQKKTEKLREVFFKGIEIVSFISLPIAFYFFILSSDIITIIFGWKWTEAIPVLKILSLGVLFRTGYKISDSLARATGAVYRRAWRQGVYALLIVCGAFIGSRFNLSFVAVGIVSALFINYILMTHLSLKLINSSWKVFFKSHILAIYITSFLMITMIPVITYADRLSLKVFPHFVVISVTFFLILFLTFFVFRRKYQKSSVRWIFSQIDEKYFGPMKFIRKMIIDPGK